MRLPLVLAAFLALPSFASLRVYQLLVTHYDFAGKKKKEEKVLSLLDPVQFEHYHNGYRWDRVVLVDTWYCPGDTSRRVYCKKPKVLEAPVRGEAVDPRIKRSEIPYNLQPVIP